MKPKSCSEPSLIFLMTKLEISPVCYEEYFCAMVTEAPLPLRGAGTLNLPFSPASLACPFSLHYKD